MALEYVVTKGVFGFDKDKNEKYVAKSVCSGRVSSSKMCGKVSHLCGVHRKVVDLFAITGNHTEINRTGNRLYEWRWQWKARYRRRWW